MGNWLKINPLRKYLTVFKISWQNSLVYRLNFIMWRIRNILSLTAIYFLWSAVFKTKQIFGWQLSSVLTYILLSSVLRSVVFSSRTVDLAWRINRGEINNFLLKPLSIFKYAFSIDLADKLLNLLFCLGEIWLLIFLFRPPLILKTNFIYFLIFCSTIFFSIILYFFVNFLIGTIGFWTPEVWAPRFLFQIVLGFAAGSYFPLDFLPRPIYLFLKLTPFSYFIFFPSQIYLKRISLGQIIQGFLILIIWTFILFRLTKLTWQKGIKHYEAQGI